jgi:hypothetical protein
VHPGNPVPDRLGEQAVHGRCRAPAGRPIAAALDDPVSRWIGGSPRDWQAITLHHLLNHTLRWDEAIASGEFPDEQITLAVITNDEAADILHVANDLLEMAGRR